MTEKQLANFGIAGQIKGSVRTKNRGFCVLCDKPVGLVDFQYAARRLKKTVREVFDLANKHRIHRAHNQKAAVMVCADSLFRQVEDQQTRKLDSNYVAGF